MKTTKYHFSLFKKFKNKKAGIFIDEANFFYAQKNLKWHLDWQKVFNYFSKFFQIKIAQYYMGLPLNQKSLEKNILVKNRIEKAGFKVITKPLKKIYLDQKKNKFIYKCNFDVEITRDVIRNSRKIDLVLLGSSDSDFIGLRNDMLNHNKGFIFTCFEYNVAWEIRRSYHLFLEDIKNQVIYQTNKKPRK